MITHQSPQTQHEPDGENHLAVGELDQIVFLSGLPFQPKVSKTAKPFQIVWYEGRNYKVRAYQNSDEAQRWFELIERVKYLFARCYGRIDRYLVFDYVEDTRPGSFEHKLARIAPFLVELAKAQPPITLQEDFDILCEDIEAAEIFRPQTMELIRLYFAQAQSPSLTWGLEYYDPLPRNFLFDEQGKFVSIDEKHLRGGPRGVSLIKLSEQLPEEDFLKVKNAYLAKVGSVPYKDPKYHEFLVFYRCLSALGGIGAHRARQTNLQEPRFHVNRQIVLKIIDASPSLRFKEEPPWVAFRRYPTWRFLRRGWRYVMRRVMRSRPPVPQT